MSFHPSLTEKQVALIERSQLFFLASAHPKMENSPKGEGPVNLSPKGGCGLHVIDANTVAYLDYPGSGNETAHHIREGGPVTVMVMSMEPEDAGIVRLYGRGQIEPEDSEIARRVLGTPAEHLANKPRQVFSVKIEQTQTSCGYGVPIFSFQAERTKEQRGRAYRD
jgi:hypothetical protein